MPFYPSPRSLLELLTWSLLNGLVIPSYPRAFYGETAQGHGYPRSHTEIFPSDALAASASTHDSGVFPQREESVVVQPRRGFPGRQVPSAAGGAADFGHRLTNYGGAQLENGKQTGTEKSPEFEAGIHGTFDPPSPPLVDLTPEDHQWLREIMGSQSSPQRHSFDSSIHGQQNRDFSPQQMNIVSSGKSTHVFNEGMVANSNIVHHRMNTESNSRLDRKRGKYREDDRQASRKRIRKGDHHFPDVPLAISNRNDPHPFPMFNPHNPEKPLGLCLNGDKVPSLPGQEQSQFEPHHEDTSYFINSQPTSTHQQLVPNPQSMRPNLPTISRSALVPAGAPRAHITQLISDSINFIGTRAATKYMTQVREELQLFAGSMGGFRKSGVIHEFEGVAAIHVTWRINRVPNLASSVVRVKPTLQERNLSNPQQISMILEPLINWMLLKQTAFFYATGQSKESLQMALDGFMMWFVKELFTPDGSLPVFGEAPASISFYDRSVFGALQQLIIEYLSTSTNAKEADQTASNVIQLWYKDGASKSGNSQLDGSFWIPMTHATESSLSTHDFWNFMNNGNEASGTKKLIKSKAVQPGHLMKEVRNLDKFELKNLFINPIFESPTRWSLHKRIGNFLHLVAESRDVIEETEFIEIVKGMVKKMFSLSKVEKGRHSSIFKKSLEVPVGLVKISRMSTKNGYCTRLLQIGRQSKLEPIPSREVAWRLVKFLSLFQGYHKLLLHVSERRSHIKIPNSQMHMLSWWCDELFSHQTGSPIFGQRESMENSLQPGQFKRHQKILIFYLSGPEQHSESDQLFLALLKYWYKTYFPDLWDQNFSNDFEYWALMSHAIGNCQVTQRLSLGDIFNSDELNAALQTFSLNMNKS